MPTSQGYIFYILQHLTAELSNFTEHRMLFQAVVIFLPTLIFFKFHVKGERSITKARSFRFYNKSIKNYSMESTSLALPDSESSCKTAARTSNVRYVSSSLFTYGFSKFGTIFGLQKNKYFCQQPKKSVALSGNDVCGSSVSINIFKEQSLPLMCFCTLRQFFFIICSLTFRTKDFCYQI